MENGPEDGDLAGQIGNAGYEAGRRLGWEHRMMAERVLLDDDEDGDDEGGDNREGNEAGRQRIPLHHFLRLLAGGRLAEVRPAANNEELVANMRSAGVVQTDAVARALRLCARDAFVPERYADEAFVDSPIRLDQHDFNVSAPHMHATCLEALGVKPGDRCLDVGCGCGLLAAALACMAGPTGLCVGIDTKQCAVRMSRHNTRLLAEAKADFATYAQRLKFERHNVFMPSHKHLGQYDRVHVGATCPPSKLHTLLALLRPGGGSIVTPVYPNDLRVVTKHADGSVTQRVISQVRYGDLEVPGDLDVLLALLELDRRARTAVPVLPSTFADDVAAILSHGTGSAAGSSPRASHDMPVSPAWCTPGNGNGSSGSGGATPLMGSSLGSSAASDTVGFHSHHPHHAHNQAQYYDSPMGTPTSSAAAAGGHQARAMRAPPPPPPPHPLFPDDGGGGAAALLGDNQNTNNGASGGSGKWPSCVARMFSSCSRGSGAGRSRHSSDGDGWDHMDVEQQQREEEADAAALASGYGGPQGAVQCDALGPPDCRLVGGGLQGGRGGRGWALPVHRSVLRVRCDQFRARCDSGMRDAGEVDLQVPDEFSLPAMRRFLYFLYHDSLGGALGGSEGNLSDDGGQEEEEDGAEGPLDTDVAVELLHVSHYYGVPRLAALCELLLGIELSARDGSDESACNAAPLLLALAHECGALQHLRAVALDFIVHNFHQVSNTDGYRGLSKVQTDEVAAACAEAYHRMRCEMAKMASPASLPDPVG